jgi:LacI family transcriptional regulator
VLNGSPHPVSAATRDRVIQAAHDLSYSPSALARALVTRRTCIIGVIVGDVVDPYFAEITRGVEDCAGRAGYLTIVCNADRRPEVEREYLNLLRDYNAEGAVFAGSGLVDDDEELNATVEQARRGGMHVVALAPRSFDGSCVMVDNRAAARDLADYLVSLGHRQGCARHASDSRASRTPWQAIRSSLVRCAKATSATRRVTPPRSTCWPGIACRTP